MTDEEKYQGYIESCERYGVRIYDKPDIYIETRERVPLTYTVKPLADCEPLHFIIDMELYMPTSILSPEGIDIIIIPYHGYIDRDVKLAIDMGATIWSLDDFIKREGDFDMSHGEGEPNTIKAYIENFDYGKLARYDDAAIYSFKHEEYAFLSNFYECPIDINGLTYTSVEAAFQAQKCINEVDKEQFTKLKPYPAKKLGKTIKPRDDWEMVKVDIMREIVSQKFLQHPALMNKLLATDNRLIVEVNAWRDTFWGVSHGKGKNHLGRILMECRNKWLD